MPSGAGTATNLDAPIPHNLLAMTDRPMEVGVGIPVRSWPDNRSLTHAEMVEFAVAADALGFDSAWAIDHFAVDGFNSGLDTIAGPDPFVFLSFVAARTHRIKLGTMVACAPFRLPGQVAREARALADLSNDRFILALGSGSRVNELAAQGLPVDHLVSRFEEYVHILVRLLSDEQVDHDGRFMRAAGLQALGGRAPVLWLAASGPRSMRLAARHAAGWSGARGGFSDQLAVLRAEEAAAGRPRGSVIASDRAQVLMIDQATWIRIQATRPELSETVVVGGSDDLINLADERRRQGCQHLILHFAGARWSNYAVEQLELAAPHLSRMRTGR